MLFICMMNEINILNTTEKILLFCLALCLIGISVCTFMLFKNINTKKMFLNIFSEIPKDLTTIQVKHNNMNITLNYKDRETLINNITDIVKNKPNKYVYRYQDGVIETIHK